MNAIEQAFLSLTSSVHKSCIMCADAKPVGIDVSLHKWGMKWKGYVTSVKCMARESIRVHGK